MDRGVKVAIFVASVVSLGLGLIWDQVLSQARVAVENTSPDEFAAEIIEGRIGSPDIPRLELQEESPPGVGPVQAGNDPVHAGNDADEPAVDQPSSPSRDGYTEYIVRANDSWWKIAHTRFAERGLKSQDLQKANPDVAVLQPGQKLRVPLSPEKTVDVARAAEDAPDSMPADPNLNEWVEYEVESGDSWWTIANRRFKDRGHGSATIQQANPDIKTLKPGQVIKIPPAG